jgi:hypothetical protein
MTKFVNVKRGVFFLLCVSLIVSMPASARATQESQTYLDSRTLGNPVVDYDVPYVHQIYDTPDDFDGAWACGPTSAVMALAFYQKLAPHPITIHKPSVVTHPNDFGYYVSSKYKAFHHPFYDMQRDPSHHAAYGAYGTSTINGASDEGRIRAYLKWHGLTGEYARNSLTSVKHALDRGYLVILDTGLTPKGHIILVKGYTDNDRLIVNDPYGNKYGPNGYGKYDGENIQYTWNQSKASGRWMVIVKGKPDRDDNRDLTSIHNLNGTISVNFDDDFYTFDGTVGTSIRLSMTKTSGTLDSYLELYGPDKYGLVAFNDDANGTWDSQIDATLPQDGSYTVVAHSYDHVSSGGYQIQLSTSLLSDVDDLRWLNLRAPLHGTIAPGSDNDTYYIYGTKNLVISIRMNSYLSSLDSYLDLYNPAGTKVKSNDDGGGDLNSWIIYRFPSSGIYRLIARSYNAVSVGGYTLSAISVRGTNYALNQSITASSREDSNYSANYATDGDLDTNWSTSSNLDQWLYIDLGQPRNISQAVIRWDAARATSYGIYNWNGSSWELLQSVSNGTGDTDVLNFTRINTRYLMLSMWNRDETWDNYSLWEFEVYDAVGTLVPTVPPDDPKAPETGIVPLIPLPPYPDGKAAPILTLLSGLEIEPLPDANPPDVLPTISLTDTYGIPTSLLTVSKSIIPPGGSISATATDAHDTDSSQIGSGIVSYRWGIVPQEPGETGSVIENLLDQSTVTISANDWLPGTYTLSLEVEDDEGNWSEPVYAEIQIQYSVYLPIIVRY